jgi:hypothetical protein
MPDDLTTTDEPRTDQDAALDAIDVAPSDVADEPADASTDAVAEVPSTSRQRTSNPLTRRPRTTSPLT